MRKLFFTVNLVVFFSVIFSVIILSTIGYETNKFNGFISKKISENNKNINLEIEKIKFKIDIKKLSLFLETNTPKLNYKKLNLPLENVKIYLDFISLIKSELKINKVNIISKEINIDQLKKLIIKTKPSSFNSIIYNKIKNGTLITNIELYFKNNLQIDNYIIKGKVKQMSAVVKNELILQDVNFNFFSDKSDILLSNITSKVDGLLIKNADVQINTDQGLKIKSNFNTDININDQNIKKYSSYVKNIYYLNKDPNFKMSLNNNLDINFDKTYKIIDYNIKSTGKLKKLKFKSNKPIKNSFLEDDIDTINLKQSNLSFQYGSDKNNYLNLSGIYQINNGSYLNYNLKNKFSNLNYKIETNFEFDQQLNISLINYKKNKNIKANISSEFDIIKNIIHLKKINYLENKNSIILNNIKMNKNKLVEFENIKVKTYKENKLNNDFSIYAKNKINIKGTKYDASNLIKILNTKTKNDYLRNINNNIEIDLESIYSPLAKKLTEFKLLGTIKEGKFVKISSKGNFGNEKFLDISLKSDVNNTKKYLEIYSDLPQPLLSEYTFFKGLTGGVLTFSSIIGEETAISKITIENFKIINAPGVVKLLSLADFGGLADLAEGEGLSFEKLEIKTSKNNGILNLNELYAVGPSISVLMEGYQDASGLTSLRGTLIPAKNLNKLLSKIPVIGNIIIPKEIGEGLFGVSFKMKGPAGKIKTTINPIKTLTPRFITKILEKSKKVK